MEKIRVPDPQITHTLFEVGIFLKGLNGFLQIVGGFLLVFLRPATLNKVVVILTQNELSEDPKDLIANFLLEAAQHLSISSQIFGAIYLLAHESIKIFLVLSLWQKRLWAYPAAIIVFLLFIFYQMYRFSLNHSP